MHLPFLGFVYQACLRVNAIITRVLVKEHSQLVFQKHPMKRYLQETLSTSQFRDRKLYFAKPIPYLHSKKAFTSVLLCFLHYFLYSSSFYESTRVVFRILILKSDIIRRKTTIFLILQGMFRIHHPSSVAKSKLKSLEHIYVYTFDKRTKNVMKEKNPRGN